MMKQQVVIYFDEERELNESIWVDENLTKEEITSIVNEKYPNWYFYDIL